jgi:hypothetical protein
MHETVGLNVAHSRLGLQAIHELGYVRVGGHFEHIEAAGLRTARYPCAQTGGSLRDSRFD